MKYFLAFYVVKYSWLFILILHRPLTSCCQIKKEKINSLLQADEACLQQHCWFTTTSTTDQQLVCDVNRRQQRLNNVYVYKFTILQITTPNTENAPWLHPFFKVQRQLQRSAHACATDQKQNKLRMRIVSPSPS